MIRKMIFLGPPGVGKGTIASELEKRYKIPWISTGTIFRENIKNKTPLGLEVKQIIDSGNYVPDDLTNKIVELRLTKSDVVDYGFILDGYPRTINQAQFLKERNLRLNIVILLEAKDEDIISRMNIRMSKENRSDDNPEIFANRLKIYKEKTAPLIEYYEKENLLVRVNATGSIEDNVAKVVEALKNDHN